MATSHKDFRHVKPSNDTSQRLALSLISDQNEDASNDIANLTRSVMDKFQELELSLKSKENEAVRREEELINVYGTLEEQDN